MGSVWRPEPYGVAKIGMVEEASSTIVPPYMMYHQFGISGIPTFPLVVNIINRYTFASSFSAT